MPSTLIVGCCTVFFPILWRSESFADKMGYLIFQFLSILESTQFNLSDQFTRKVNRRFHAAILLVSQLYAKWNNHVLRAASTVSNLFSTQTN